MSTQTDAARGRADGADPTDGLPVAPPPLADPDEPVDAFAARARAWLAEHVPRLPEGVDNHTLGRADGDGSRARQLQHTLYEGGFAGICYPRAYGGQGLSPDHQRAFTRESIGYEMPTLLNTPTLTIIAPTILDVGTEAQKRRHIPRILAGETMWSQFLSEPTGGSDLAGVTTRARRDGDVFLLSGSKVWSSGAFRSDHAVCLARTDWHVPKHRGLTMFILPIHQPGVEVQRIRMADGSDEFCQEFFDDVVVPVGDVLGQVGEGWAVASQLLVHERAAMGANSPFSSGVASGASGGVGWATTLTTLVRATGTGDDARIRRLVAEARARDLAQPLLVRQTAAAMAAGALPSAAGAIPRLFSATNAEQHYDAALDIAGTRAVAAPPGDPVALVGLRFLMRQQASLGGGSNEMQRNLISERVLGMPREYAADRDRPFDEVRTNAPPRRGGG